MNLRIILRTFLTIAALGASPNAAFSAPLARLLSEVPCELSPDQIADAVDVALLEAWADRISQDPPLGSGQWALWRSKVRVIESGDEDPLGLRGKRGLSRTRIGANGNLEGTIINLDRLARRNPYIMCCIDALVARLKISMLHEWKHAPANVGGKGSRSGPDGMNCDHIAMILQDMKAACGLYFPGPGSPDSGGPNPMPTPPSPNDTRDCISKAMKFEIDKRTESFNADTKADWKGKLEHCLEQHGSGGGIWNFAHPTTDSDGNVTGFTFSPCPSEGNYPW